MDYISSFQDNIPSSTFNTASSNTLNWIEENRDKHDWAKDPNAYEMTNLFLFGAKYSHENGDVNTDTLSRMWNIRSKDFGRCNISENNFVYKICRDSYQSILSGKPMVNDENSHHALRKMAGLGLYLKQQQRDTGEISYNNPQELIELMECSRSLKTFHPDLFERYSFDKNINRLCQLQLEHELTDEVKTAIKTAQDNIFKQSLSTEKNNGEKTYESDIEHN